eukprot:g20757.t1
MFWEIDVRKIGGWGVFPLFISSFKAARSSTAQASERTNYTPGDGYKAGMGPPRSAPHWPSVGSARCSRLTSPELAGMAMVHTPRTPSTEPRRDFPGSRARSVQGRRPRALGPMGEDPEAQSRTISRMGAREDWENSASRADEVPGTAGRTQSPSVEGQGTAQLPLLRGVWTCGIMEGQDDQNQDLTLFVQNLLKEMQGRFQTMSDSIINRSSEKGPCWGGAVGPGIDDMGARIDDLEKSISELIQEAGAEDAGRASSNASSSSRQARARTAMDCQEQQTRRSEVIETSRRQQEVQQHRYYQEKLERSAREGDRRVADEELVDEVVSAKAPRVGTTETAAPVRAVPRAGHVDAGHVAAEYEERLQRELQRQQELELWLREEEDPHNWLQQQRAQRQREEDAKPCGLDAGLIHAPTQRGSVSEDELAGRRRQEQNARQVMVDETWKQRQRYVDDLRDSELAAKTRRDVAREVLRLRGQVTPALSEVSTSEPAWRAAPSPRMDVPTPVLLRLELG